MFAVTIENLKKTRISYIFKETSSLSIVSSKCGQEYEKKIKEKESIKILKILGLINNIEKYQEVYNHV